MTKFPFAMSWVVLSVWVALMANAYAPTREASARSQEEELSDLFPPLREAIDRQDPGAVEKLWSKMVRTREKVDFVCNVTNKEYQYLDGCARFLLGKWERPPGKFRGYLLETYHGGGSSAVIDLKIRRSSDDRILEYTGSAWTVFCNKETGKIKHDRLYSELRGEVMFWYDRPPTYGPDDARILVIEYDDSALVVPFRADAHANQLPGLYICKNRPTDVLSKPHVFSEKLGKIPSGTRIASFGKEGNFFRIEHGNMTGYVHKDSCMVVGGKLAAQKSSAGKTTEEKPKQAPNDIGTWLELARQKERNNDKTGAMEAYRQVLDLSPDHEDASEAYLRLRLDIADPTRFGKSPELVIQEGVVHADLFFESHDGSRYLVGGWGRVQLFNKDGSLVRSFPEFRRSVCGLYITRDNSKVIASCVDGILRIFTVESGKEVVHFKIPSGGTMAVDPEERFIIVPEKYYQLNWYDFSGNLFKTMSYPSVKDSHEHHYNITKMIFSKDGQYLFCSSGNNMLFCVDKHGKLVFHTTQPYFSGTGTGDCPISLTSGHNSSPIAFLSLEEKCLKLMDMTGNITKVISFDDYPRYFASSPVADIAAVSCMSTDWKRRFVKIIDTRTGETRKTINGLGGEIFFSRDGSFFVVVESSCLSFFSPSGTLIKRWTKQTTDVGRLFPLQGENSYISLSKDLLHFNLQDFSARVSSPQTVDSLYSVCSNDNGTLFAIGGDKSGDENGYVDLFNEELSHVKSLTLPGRRQICGLAISPDDRYLATISYSCDVDIWDIRSGNNVANFKNGHIGDASGVVFAPDGASIYFVLSYKKEGSNYNHFDKIRQMDLKGQIIRTFDNSNGASGLRLTPDRRNLVASGNPGTITVFDLEGNLLASMDQNARWSGRVSFSDDGRYMSCGYSYTGDHKMKVWDFSSRKIVNTIHNGEDSSVGSVVFLRNNRFLMSSANGQFSVWDREKGDKVLTLVFFKDGGWICFAPDGKYDVSSQGRKYISWNIDGKLIDPGRFEQDLYRPALFREVTRGSGVR